MNQSDLKSTNQGDQKNYELIGDPVIPEAENQF
jgi:hypothetical protein